MSYDEDKKEMEDFLDDLLDYLDNDGKYGVIEKIDYDSAILTETITSGFKFQITIKEK